MHSFEEVINFAIQHEEEEAAFYREMATRSKTRDQKEIMLEYALQEEDHKRRLQGIMENDCFKAGKRRCPDPDLKLSDYLVVDDRPNSMLGYQDALLLAAKREKKARQLYLDLAGRATNPNIQAVLMFLAEQEGKHASSLEQKYDDTLQ
ncbi:MAG: ferritin family protein [Magnetococcales bacterium]|nr:ferritin family protein [Magnetococcales bacterium]